MDTSVFRPPNLRPASMVPVDVAFQHLRAQPFRSATGNPRQWISQTRRISRGLELKPILLVQRPPIFLTGPSDR